MLLALETATDVCGVALLDGDRVAAERATDAPRTHATRLAPMIAEVLDEAGVSASDLTRIAVSAGPGSFTGLRIGLGTASGLALSTGAALVMVPTLDALVASAREAGLVGASARAVGILPSRRGEVYVGGDGAPPRVVPVDALSGLGGVQVLGSPEFGSSIAITGVVHQPSALAVARWALAHGAAVAPAGAVPLYVQPFVPLVPAAR